LFAWKICRLHFLIDISQSGAFSAGGTRHITGASKADFCMIGSYQ
jgi:hypothetical protein